MLGANYLQFKKNTSIIHSWLGMVCFNESMEGYATFFVMLLMEFVLIVRKGIVVFSFILIVSSIGSLREGDLHLGF